MKLKEFKERLQTHINDGDELLFRLEDGSLIPPYFHITEMGIKIKHFVDCGGVVRTEECINFQMEYQTNTIGSYTLEESDYPNALFTLKSKKTNCLAPDKCVVTQTSQCGPSCC